MEIWKVIKSEISKYTYSSLKNYHNFITLSESLISINFNIIDYSIKERDNIYYVRKKEHYINYFFICPSIHGLLSLLCDDIPMKSINIINKITSVFIEFEEKNYSKYESFNKNELNKINKLNFDKLTFDTKYCNNIIHSNSILIGETSEKDTISIQFSILKLEDDYYHIHFDSNILERTIVSTVDQFNSVLRFINKIKIILNEIS